MQIWMYCKAQDEIEFVMKSFYGEDGYKVVLSVHDLTNEEGESNEAHFGMYSWDDDNEAELTSVMTKIVKRFGKADAKYLETIKPFFHIYQSIMMSAAGHADLHFSLQLINFWDEKSATFIAIDTEEKDQEPRVYSVEEDAEKAIQKLFNLEQRVYKVLWWKRVKNI